MTLSIFMPAASPNTNMVSIRSIVYSKHEYFRCGRLNWPEGAQSEDSLTFVSANLRPLKVSFIKPNMFLIYPLHLKRTLISCLNIIPNFNWNWLYIATTTRHFSWPWTIHWSDVQVVVLWKGKAAECRTGSSGIYNYTVGENWYGFVCSLTCIVLFVDFFYPFTACLFCRYLIDIIT